jgi:cobalamin biosynthesis protein CobD/CbiB
MHIAARSARQHSTPKPLPGIARLAVVLEVVLAGPGSYLVLGAGIAAIGAAWWRSSPSPGPQ